MGSEVTTAIQPKKKLSRMGLAPIHDMFGKTNEGKLSQKMHLAALFNETKRSKELSWNTCHRRLEICCSEERIYRYNLDSRASQYRFQECPLVRKEQYCNRHSRLEGTNQTHRLRTSQPRHCIINGNVIGAREINTHHCLQACTGQYISLVNETIQHLS